MNTRQLQYVIAVAEERSFSKAADKLYISQPSLSQYIRSIEKSLEADLFDRSVAPLALTEIGEEYVRTAYKIIGLENNLLKFVSDQREKRISTLNIGVSAYLNTEEIGLTLAEMRTIYPNINIYMHELFSITMDNMLEQGELDFSISPITSSYDTTKFCRDIVSRDRFYLATSRFLLERLVPELADADTGDLVRLEQFAGMPFLTLSEHSLQTHSFNLAAERAGFVPDIIMQCRRWDMLITLVEENVGVTLLTDRVLIDSNVEDNIVLLRLNPPAPDLVGAISYLREAYLPEAARTFISCYKRVVAKHRDAEGYLNPPYIA